jgi:hypothetical protein
VAVLPVDPGKAYDLVSDVVATASHCDELLDVHWEQRSDPSLVTVGDRLTFLQPLHWA